MDPKKKLRRVRFTRQFSAPREKVFELFASHERFGAALTGPAGEKLGVVRRVEDAHSSRMARREDDQPVGGGRRAEKPHDGRGLPLHLRNLPRTQSLLAHDEDAQLARVQDLRTAIHSFPVAAGLRGSVQGDDHCS